jgi:hypothetical protein
MADRAQQVVEPLLSSPSRRGGSHPLPAVQHKAPVPNAGALWGVLGLGADLAGDDVRGVGRRGDGEEREEGGPALP